MAKIIQSDNAVVDYSTIKALIDTVNNLSDTVDKIDLRTKGVDSTGKSVTKIFDSGTAKVDSGTSTLTVKFNKTFTSKPVVTAMLVNATKTMTIRIENFAGLTPSSVKFALNEKATATTTVSWIAVGDGAAN